MSIELASFGRAALFLGIPFVLVIFYLQWHWAQTCDNNIQVLVAQTGGGGKFMLAPKSGSDVTITDPTNKEVTRTWPINELATIDVPYPGVGFVPKWMQKSIRLAILNEGDWEPMLNRSPHRKKVASPDVLEFLREIANQESIDDGMRTTIMGFIGGISTGPTREMIADPSILGSLMRSGVMKALASVSNDLTEALRDVTAQLARMTTQNPVVVYIGLGLTLALLVFMTFKIVPAMDDIVTLSGKMDAVIKALGVTIPK